MRKSEGGSRYFSIFILCFPYAGFSLLFSGNRDSGPIRTLDFSDIMKNGEVGKMRLERMANTDHERYADAWKLYKASFPYHEQRETASQEKILRDKGYFFDLIYDGELFVGLLLYWETDLFLYVEHFCILPEMRNRRYGQRTLAWLKESGKKVILEIDPPADDISLRRKGFYIRNGLVENPYPHIHPPYHKENSGHRLVVMSYPSMLSEQEYLRFRRFLEDRVMDGAVDASGGE